MPTSLCDKPRWSSPKERAHDLSVLVVIRDVIVVLELLIHTVLTGESAGVSEYKSNLVMMPVQILTRQRYFPVCKWVTVEFLTPFFCVRNIGDNLSARCMILLLCVSSHILHPKAYIHPWLYVHTKILHSGNCNDSDVQLSGSNVKNIQETYLLNHRQK